MQNQNRDHNVSAMTTKQTTPKEWNSLPQWVREEWERGRLDNAFHRPLMQRLVDHSANMATVWKLLDSKRDSSTRTGPLGSLLSLMRIASSGMDPGSNRSRADRLAIAGEIQKHAEALIKQIDRIGSSSPFGTHPALLADSMDQAAAKIADSHVTTPFQAVIDEIESGSMDLELSDAAKNRLIEEIEYLRNELELRVRRLYSDPRPALRTLSDGVQGWAEEATWGRSEKILSIADGVESLLKGRHDAAAATIASALLDEEVTPDMVKGVMSRRA